MQMTGKVIVITGASRGIGAAAAHAFAQAGAKVVLLARSGGEIGATAAEIGASALAIPCDVADYAQVEAAVAKTIKAFGRIDVFIGNAGMLEPITHLADADPDAWGKVIDVNLKGVFNGMRAAMPPMIAQGSGTIITVSSGAAHNPVEAWSAYCSSKAGAYMLTRCADHEARDKGLRVMGLSPGTVATDMQRDIKASGINPISALDWSVHIPPEWPARALVWMCSAEADEFCGTDISLREDEIRKRVGLI
ncbi:MAG: SDR family oxidoreductase [Octadecabacter sp.]|nr:SDR family oxidoreductase [Octadecabacter sp.]